MTLYYWTSTSTLSPIHRCCQTTPSSSCHANTAKYETCVDHSDNPTVTPGVRIRRVQPLLTLDGPTNLCPKPWSNHNNTAQQWVNMGSSHSGFCLDLLTADQLHRLDATVRQVVVAAQPDLTVRSHQIQRQFTYSPRSFELMDVAELSRNMMWSMMDEVTAYVRALETKETLMNKTGVQRTCYYIQGLNTHVDHHSTLRLHCNVIQLETASPT
jgi:hypothetical protein